MKVQKVILIILFLCAVVLIGNFVYSQTEEKLSIVTYYPSPYGSYRELEWGRAGYSNAALSDAEGGSVILGGTNFTSGGDGRPFISFTNRYSGVDRARITLINSTTLRLDTGKFMANRAAGARIMGCILQHFETTAPGGPEDNGMTLCPTGTYSFGGYIQSFWIRGDFLCCSAENRN